MNLKIKIRSDDLKFIQRGKNFENTFNGILIKTSKKLGKDIANVLKDSMKNGGWPPNEPKYKAWKGLYGYNTEPLFRTDLLYKSVASEVKINLPNSVGGEVGWHPGARYGGDLQKRRWARAVPKRRKKDLGTPNDLVDRFSHNNTNFLANVAKWNNDGEGQITKVSTVRYQVGIKRKRWKTKNVIEITRLGRVKRPFVDLARTESVDLVFERYSDATTQALSRIFYMTKYWRTRLTPADEVPF